MSIRYLLTALFIYFTSTLVAQSSKLGLWCMYLGNNKLTNNIALHNELQYRSYNYGEDLEQLLIRTGLGYNLSENNNTILLGYAYIHSQPYAGDGRNKMKSDEHRIFQQFITKQNFGRLQITHRYRIEERFINTNFKMRYRYSIWANIHLNKTEMSNGTWYISSYNEIFINHTSTLFDRNRVYAGFGYGLSKTLRIELGAMTQLLESSSRTQIMLSLFNNFSFKD